MVQYYNFSFTVYSEHRLISSNFDRNNILQTSKNKMRIVLFFLFVTGFCSNVIAQDSVKVQFMKASEGSEYLIIPSTNGVKATTGNFLQLQVTATYKDSVLFNTREEGMPQFGMYDTASFPHPFKEAFNEIHVGDSIVIRISTDSIIARGQSAPFLRKGEFVYQSYFVSNVYTAKEQVDSAQKFYVPMARKIAYKKQKATVEHLLVENKDQIAADSKLIEAYLAKKKLKAIKTTWGTYIVFKKEGTGRKLTVDDIASVNYSGKIMGTVKLFDSNIDPKFKHVTPYDVPLGQLNGIITGWPDAILQMKMGSVATIYIPSTLAYGAAGRDPEIKPNAILEFDMTIVKVMTEEENAKRIEEAKEKENAVPKKVSPPKQKASVIKKTKTPVKTISKH
jgi:FKBP-type peptidyl-prolyl cis-trans isomerase